MPNTLDTWRRWYDETMHVYRRGGARVWVTDVRHVVGDLVGLAVSPPKVLERGHELWLLDLSSGNVVARLHWDGVDRVGMEFQPGPTFWTVGFEDGGVYEFRPEDAVAEMIRGFTGERRAR